MTSPISRSRARFVDALRTLPQIPRSDTPAPMAHRNRTAGGPDTDPLSKLHFVNHPSIGPPFPAGMQRAMFGMGCFWGAERKFWPATGVWTTAVGYAGGKTPNPTYEQVCSGRTGHAEVVLVVYDPAQTTYEQL